MTLTIEDGTAVAGADSYVDETDCTAYLAAHYTTAQLATWTGKSSGDKEILIRNAAQFITATCRGQWVGRRVDEDQGLDWPRCSAYDADDMLIDDETVPQVVIDAQCELVYRSVSAALISDVSPTSGGIVSESKSGAGFSKSVTYGSDGKQTQTQFTLVDRMLAPLLHSGGRIVRG